jgi:aryl-alcohol dehydrogenase-like predicted oxidoreductase
MPMRVLGRTGERVSLLGMGGYHLGLPDEKEAVRLVHEAIDRGVTFFDNCWDYNGGESERRLGLALAGGRRKRVFVMTKLDGRTKAAAAAQLEQSLSRLRTDVIDLVQVHEVIRREDPARVFGPGGAIEALVAAREAGKIRFIGFTGHKSPSIHLLMLETARRHGFAFDTVQLPLNPFDAHYDSFEKKVLPVLERENIGVLGMKALGGGIILSSGLVDARECLRYAMSLPTDVVITGIESQKVLDQAIEVATTFTPMTETERRELLARTEPAARDGRFEKFKSTNVFDGTVHHPDWLTSTKS